MRQDVARTMSVPVDKLRVVSLDVGGAFGMRTSGYPEYPAILVAAKMLGRPVRWRSTRQEGFLTDNQARDTIFSSKVNCRADGTLVNPHSRHRACFLRI
jgi:carbon-monoxide dehydrogenase large subunit